MASGSEEDGWIIERDMEWQKVANKRKKKKSSNSGSETDDTAKKEDNATSEQQFKVIVTFEDNFHLISIAKAIERLSLLNI